jgi:thioredoxin 1
MKRTVEVTEATFEREVLKSNRPVLVEFARAWSFPPLRLEEVLDELATDFDADYFKAGRVALDRSPNLGSWYGIRCIPTFLRFVDPVTMQKRFDPDTDLMLIDPSLAN